MRRERIHLLWLVLGSIVLAMALASTVAAVTLGEPTALPVKGRYTAAIWSPAGGGLALAGERGKGLYYTDPSGNMSTISESPLSGWGFNWSPDGQHLAYRMREEDGTGVAMMITDDQGKPKQLTPFMDGRFQSTWGKDGLTYKAGDELVTVDANGDVKKVRSISQGRGLLARIMNVTGSLMAARITGATLTALSSLSSSGASPDGKMDKRAFVDSESQAWVVDENGNMKKLIELDDVKGYATPVESPNQNEYALRGFDGNLYVADPNSTQPVNLGEGGSPTWSPDGQYIIYTKSTDDGHRLTSSDLWIASKDGSFKMQLTNGEGVKESPSWSPDGKSISYIVDGAVYTAPIDM